MLRTRCEHCHRLIENDKMPKHKCRISQGIVSPCRSCGNDLVAYDGHTKCRTCQRLKARKPLLEKFGGACQDCGYSKYEGALHFHHIDSTYKKEFSKSSSGTSLLEVLQFPERFRLICANCHAETHKMQNVA